MAARELPEESDGQEGRSDCGVEGDWVEAGRARRDGRTPGKGRGEAGVGAFGEVAEGEEGPGEGRAGGPGIEGVEEGEMAETEVDGRREDGEEDAKGVKRRQCEQKDRVRDEAVWVGDD